MTPTRYLFVGGFGNPLVKGSISWFYICFEVFYPELFFKPFPFVIIRYNDIWFPTLSTKFEAGWKKKLDKPNENGFSHNSTRRIPTMQVNGPYRGNK